MKRGCSNEILLQFFSWPRLYLNGDILKLSKSELLQIREGNRDNVINVINEMLQPIISTVLHIFGALIAQWFKSWPSDLAFPSLSPPPGKIFSAVNRVRVHTAFPYHPPTILI